MSRLSIYPLILVLAALAFPGCAEEPEDSPENTETESVSFKVTPHVDITGTNYRDDVRVDHVFLGIGQVILEPLDDLQAPIISNRTAATVVYDLSSNDLNGDTLLPSLEVPKPGRYLVTLAVEPQEANTDPRPDQAMHLFSIELLGTFFRDKMQDCNPFTDPNCSPEPVPWMPGNGMFSSNLPEQTIDRNVQEEIPFAYRSERTGYIRLGEVQLSPELNQLQINVNLDGWLDEALRPVLAEVSSTPEQAPSLDLSGRLEGYGLGLEKLFMLSEAFSL